MRRSGARFVQPESDSERLRAALRSAQWSVYFRRFFGGRADDQVPGMYAPLSFEQAAGLLGQTCHGAQRRAARHQTALRRTFSQVLLARFGSIDGVTSEFEPVLRKAAGGRKDPARALRAFAEREFGVEDAFRRRAFSLQDALEGGRTVSVPTEVTHRGDAFSVKKEVYFRQPFRAYAKRLVNPLNWTQLGEYFTTTERGDRDQTTDADRNPISWSGVFHEKFGVSWNGFTTQTFDQHIKVDYTVLPSSARADYFLMYDFDDQIALNEGFFEAREDSAHPGWMSVTMVKTVRFTSSVLNFMAPAILAMVLDSKAGGFRSFVEENPPRSSRA
jgi:hypothetical protein